MDEDSLSDEEEERMLARLRRNNFGFAKLEHLAGNVGYLDLRGFNEARWAGRTAVAAMNFLAHSDAVIIDLRQNGGGNPSMIQLISSYFFDEPVHLNSFYIRDEDRTKQFWSHAFVDGPRMTDVDLYILTSARTFSAAEEFTYNMKNLERATIVGETTGGGAHPVRMVGFPDLKVRMSLPFGRAVNPITGTNWEGTGIEPHIAVPQAEALDVAHLEALRRLGEKTEDEEMKAALDWDIKRLSARTEPVTLDPERAAQYAGTYGPRQLTYEDGRLYYQRGDNPRIQAIPIDQVTFVFDEYDFFMLEVETDEDGKPTALIGHYRDGRTDRSARSE
jgi:C-terminal processing protease CtpA/Prc